MRRAFRWLLGSVAGALLLFVLGLPGLLEDLAAWRHWLGWVDGEVARWMVTIASLSSIGIALMWGRPMPWRRNRAEPPAAGGSKVGPDPGVFIAARQIRGAGEITSTGPVRIISDEVEYGGSIRSMLPPTSVEFDRYPAYSYDLAGRLQLLMDQGVRYCEAVGTPFALAASVGMARPSTYDIESWIADVELALANEPRLLAQLRSEPPPLDLRRLAQFGMTPEKRQLDHKLDQLERIIKRLRHE